MAKLNKSEAARAAGKARGTIQKWIKSGRLTAETDAQGRVVIDTAELERCFGPLEKDSRPRSQNVRELLDEIVALKHSIEIFEVKSKLKDDLIKAKDEQISHLKDERRILLGQSTSGDSVIITPPPPVKEAAKRGWWIFGRKAA